MLICKVFGHKRSARKARFNSDTMQWESVCKRCGEPLVRHQHGDWRPAISKL
ncbi:hypothetical protein G7077_10165 [Sphingomonas piscis]|uniref:Uncharacterized protein n=1 Tax=Sphingomonas piscis TaxID=2714943 RepID=A0A6G7YR37_9SPHN|nr:hypothetical protein G7077_10165 [Sphingomonas piscis]